MAEKIVSPGVFTNEVDQSFLPAGVQAIGAAVVGPTAKGPAGIPTIVSSYSEFVQTFGAKFTSGSGASENSYKFLTNYAAKEYLKYADTLTVVRILAGNYGPANSVVSSSVSSGATFASSSMTFAQVPSGSQFGGGADEITIGSTKFMFVSESAGYTNSSTQVFVQWAGAGAATTKTTVAAAFRDAINNTITSTNLGITASSAGAVVIISGSQSGTGANLTVSTGSGGDVTSTTPSFLAPVNIQGGTNTTTETKCFTLHTLSDGADQNSYTANEGVNGTLASGSESNVRWEVTSRNNAKGTFNLIIRRGDDTYKRKTILEQYNNLTLDPNSTDYIARRLGDQVNTLRDSGTTDPFLQLSGSFVNKSKYVRVEVHKNTYNYLDANGNIRDGALSGSLPSVSSGSFINGSDGNVQHPRGYYEKITDTNVQGYNPDVAAHGGTAYSDAIKLLKNADEYDINLITLPGLVNSKHGTTLGELIDMCESRADCFAVIDPILYGAGLASATTQAESRDTNYASMYWPWVKIPDADLGRNVWVPASTLIPSVYAFNDRVAAPWFAPAGLNRGGIDIAVMAERKLTHANRDTLYESNVNPIATFPNAGVTVFGQKTLQKKASALDRVNVRRLLIAAKKFIASTTKFLVFENNTAATRNRFLSIVNPYFESVQQRQGLYAFKVVMDETNNTPDVIDRNEMRGQIFLQPAKAAEFIIIDFNIMPTGAAFPE
jgi:hypothetical protein